MGGYNMGTIVWAKICENLLGVKVHTSCKISKFCQYFGATKTHIDKIFGILKKFYLKRKGYRYYQEKSQVGLTSSSYINLTMKL